MTMDDATSTICSAFFCDEEGTASSFRGLMQVFTERGLPCALYTDRGCHDFHTPEAGGKVDKARPTQVGRALAQLGIEHIPACSPEARGRSKRLFGTLQGSLVRELADAGIAGMDAANRFLKEVHISAHNKRFAGLVLQIPESPGRHHFVKARVRVHRYPDGDLAIFHGPRRIARYDKDGRQIEETQKRAA